MHDAHLGADAVGQLGAVRCAGGDLGAAVVGGRGAGDEAAGLHAADEAGGVGRVADQVMGQGAHRHGFVQGDQRARLRGAEAVAGGDGGEVVVVAADDDREGFQQFVRSRDGAGCRFRRHGRSSFDLYAWPRGPEPCPPRNTFI